VKRRNAQAVALALAVLAGGAGCASTETANDGVNPEVPLWFHRPSGAMNVFVHRALTAGSRTVGEDYERGRAEIDPVHARIFVGSADHGLYALRATNGSTLWRFETLGLVQSEPYYDAALDVVYFGSHDGALYCVRAQNGELVWRFDTRAEVARKVARLGETLFVANASDQLFALDRRTGKRLWEVHRTPALGMEVAGYAGPAADNGLVYMAYSDGHVIAYDAKDGSEKWTPVDLAAEAEQAATGDTPRYLDVDTTPVLDTLPNGARVVYVASYAGGMHALDAATGRLVWSNDKAVGVTEIMVWSERAHPAAPDTPNMPGGDDDAPWVPARKLVLASSGTSGLWALDPQTGRMLWRLPLPEGGITAPVSIAGALLVGTTRYGLFLLSPRNGRPIDGIDLATGFAETPAAYGDRAFVLSNGGTLLGVQVIAPLGHDRRWRRRVTF
jgi:outer membrane protein assembly factor BamB